MKNLRAEARDKEVRKGPGEVGHVRDVHYSSKGVGVPAPQDRWRLAAASNSSSRRSYALF